MTSERMPRIVDVAGLLRDAYYNDRAEDVQDHLQELRDLLARDDDGEEIDPPNEAIEAMAQFLWRKYDPDPDDIGPLPFEVNEDGWRRDARALWALASR